MKITYNEASVKNMSLEQFIKNQAHHSKHTDLVADWERITGKKAIKSAKEPPAQAEQTKG